MYAREEIVIVENSLNYNIRFMQRGEGGVPSKKLGSGLFQVKKPQNSPDQASISVKKCMSNGCIMTKNVTLTHCF